VSSTQPAGKPLYTPGQTFTATIVGGPAAGAWTLFRNFHATSRNRAAGFALIAGIVVCVLVAIIALKYAGYFPLYHINPIVVPLAYSGGALVLAHVLFANIVTAHIQLGGRRKSWWSVAVVAIVGLVVLCGIVALVHTISPAVDFL
jgi:hypothetical protein